MPPKLREMDDIIRQIHSAISAAKYRRTLFVVCGDHGMNEVGNHGGSSYLEQAAAMAFLTSEKAFERPLRHPVTIDQVDLVPTLSQLFDVPIPINSLGVVISELFRRQG